MLKLLKIKMQIKNKKNIKLMCFCIDNDKLLEK